MSLSTCVYVCICVYVCLCIVCIWRQRQVVAVPHTIPQVKHVLEVLTFAGRQGGNKVHYGCGGRFGGREVR
jgi:hypothetical protein